MRSFKIMMIAAVIVGLGSSAYAELQNVQVGGSIRIRGNWFDFDDTIGEVSFVEQRTTIDVTADFTDEVSAFIELDSYDIWGEDFRSDYVTGLDFRAASGDDVELYQAYIEAREMWGTALRARIGRQELSFGSEWLIGVNNASSIYQGLSFDGIRLTYATDVFSVDAFWTKLAERFGEFGDNDVDFYGLYGSYTGFEDIVVDLYWLYVREDEAPAGSGNIAALPGIAGTDTDLHTIGLRGAGTIGAFDFEAEVAFQTGDVQRVNVFPWPFETEDLDYSGLGVNLEGGYTFDMNWQPRVYLGFAYLEGGDNEPAGLFGLGNGGDLSFNRLFSNWEYSEFIENTDLSNVFVYRAGVSAMPTESLSLLLALTYFTVDETTEVTFPASLFLEDGDDTLGWELGLYADYQYSEDLVFRAGYAHFFGDDGLDALDGNLYTFNGLAGLASDDDDDFDYLFWEAEISF